MDAIMARLLQKFKWVIYFLVNMIILKEINWRKKRFRLKNYSKSELQLPFFFRIFFFEYQIIELFFFKKNLLLIPLTILRTKKFIQKSFNFHLNFFVQNLLIFCYKDIIFYLKRQNHNQNVYFKMLYFQSKTFKLLPHVIFFV